MKKQVILSITLNIFAIVSFVLSIVLRRGGTDPMVSNVLLCSGSVFLLVGGFLSRKTRK